MSTERPIQICLSALESGLRSEIRYHTLEHTLMVMENMEEIAEAEGIQGHDLNMLRVGAASHDCGFLVTVTDHEEAGCAWVEPILVESGYSDEDVAVIKGLIMATKLPQSPRTHLEEILCDADLAYIGTDRYTEIATLLYDEMIALGSSLTQTDWLDIQINFLGKHTFFTAYARATWNEGKARVIENLRQERSRL